MAVGARSLVKQVLATVVPGNPAQDIRLSQGWLPVTSVGARIYHMEPQENNDDDDNKGHDDKDKADKNDNNDKKDDAADKNSGDKGDESGDKGDKFELRGNAFVC